MGIQDFKLKLHCRSMSPTSEFPKGCIFSCDTAEQFTSPLLQKDHELIGKLTLTLYEHLTDHKGCLTHKGDGQDRN